MPCQQLTSTCQLLKNFPFRPMENNGSGCVDDVTDTNTASVVSRGKIPRASDRSEYIAYFRNVTPDVTICGTGADPNIPPPWTFAQFNAPLRGPVKILSGLPVAECRNIGEAVLVTFSLSVTEARGGFGCTCITWSCVKQVYVAWPMSGTATIELDCPASPLTGGALCPPDQTGLPCTEECDHTVYSATGSVTFRSSVTTSRLTEYRGIVDSMTLTLTGPTSGTQTFTSSGSFSLVDGGRICAGSGLTAVAISAIAGAASQQVGINMQTLKAEQDEDGNVGGGTIPPAGDNWEFELGPECS